VPAPWKIAISPDGKWALAATDGSDDGIARKSPMIYSWDLRGGKPLTNLVKHSAHPGPITSLHFSPDGKLALSACADGIVKLWRVPQWKEYAPLDWSEPGLEPIDKAVIEAVFTPDGNYVVTARRGGLVLSEVRSGMVALCCKERSFVHVAVLPDGKRAVTSYGQVVKLWDLKAGQELRTLMRGKG
jgi:WD40 repeat protein